jgi:hypothetical protein
MPVYLFTFHAYRSWMPDHPRGYTKRRRGYLAPDEDMAENYRRRANGDGILFDAALQRALIEEAGVACVHQNLRMHAGSTEPSHVHLLVSWRSAKTWTQVRASLKSSLSRLLSRTPGGGRINPDETDTGACVLKLSRGGSRKQVRDRAHFNHLMTRHLPDHSGVKWFDDRGWVGAKQ